MKSLLAVWKPKRGFIKFIKGVISAICIVLFLAFLILPFCKFDGAYFSYSKYVWIICALINIDVFYDYKENFKNKVITPITTLYVILALTYLHNYWYVLEKTTVIFVSVLVGLTEFIASVWVYRTIKFTAKQDSPEFPKDTVKAIVAGCVYIGAITLFVWAHFLSKPMIFIFGGISAILLTVSALSVLGKGFFVKKNGFKLVGFLADVVTLLGLIVYLIYLIPSEENLQEIVLSIVAAVIGGAITLAGVAWTIKDNSEKLKEERKFSIKPYLETKRYHHTDVLKLPEEDTIYIEINKGLFTYQGAIPSDIMDFRGLKSRVINSEKVDPMDQALYEMNQETYSEKRYLLYYEIANHGAGNAINVQLKINKWSMQSFCITTANPKRFVFILHENLIPDDKNEYTLEIFLTYSDIASLGNYYQKEEIIFCRRDDKLKTIQMSGSILTRPIEIPIGLTGDQIFK